MTETRNRPKSKPPSTPRGGYIIARRDPDARRLAASPAPYEHSSRAAARAEAKALTERFGSEFVVFKELAPVATSKKVGG